MTNAPNKGKGKAVAWLHAHVGHQGEACLIWPFKALPTGYGQFSHLGVIHYAHRYMCELVNGPPPTPKHQAGHSCGNGHLSCAHPKHLEWKTNGQNQLDRRKHGTKNHATWGKRGKLMPHEVLEIRAIGRSMTYVEIAAKFNVCESNIRKIIAGKIWTGDYAPEKRLERGFVRLS